MDTNTLAGYCFYTEGTLARKARISIKKLRAILASDAFYGIEVLVTGKTPIIAVPEGLNLDLLTHLAKHLHMFAHINDWEVWLALHLLARASRLGED